MSAALSLLPGSAVVAPIPARLGAAQTRGTGLPLVESFRGGDVASPSVTAPVVTKGTQWVNP